MKKLLLSLILAAASINAQVTIFPWEETFETNSGTIDQWICEYISGTNSSVPSGMFWSLRTTASVGYFGAPAYEGEYMADFDSRSHSRDGVAKFISPVLDLTYVSNPTLEFVYRNMMWSPDQNILNIYYRISPADPWILLTSFDSNITSWTPISPISLPNKSATYQIALEGQAKYGYSINIDNLMIQSSSLATSEVSKISSFKIYPNPASDYINISSDSRISEIAIFDLSGKQLTTLKYENAPITIPVNNLSTGIYIIQVKNTDGSITSHKFIKK
ncbi:hypothetical protein M2347_001202 [Chryseobacterium sp. H1D6B]|uniref:T9SS type A sorting domain-containing protein n=1 Tax=Chryseobacterium sp. H1D6B TaxID=2940588 RepID=UPI0015C82A40|nr:T9SS type A sorting domain-containing protein [Chryseobacterium sp. H1D6B]MDH6251475.1 hypothetical protein [Chryseobacterium sp. H1D6B]